MSHQTDVENYESVVKSICGEFDADVRAYVARYQHHGFLWRESVGVIASICSGSTTTSFDTLPLSIEVGIAFVQLERALQVHNVVPVVQRSNSANLLSFLEQHQFLKDCGPFDECTSDQDRSEQHTKLSTPIRVTLDQLVILLQYVANLPPEHALWQTLIDSERERKQKEQRRQQVDNVDDIALPTNQALLQIVKNVVFISY